MPDGETILDRLAGFISEPYRHEEVLEAARKLQPPFLLREVVAETGLPRMVVHTRLTRAVKKGVLKRAKANMMVDGGPWAGRYTKPCWLYSWVDA